MILPTDKRVRYAPELAVWTVDTGDGHTGGADHLLAAMMAYAAEAGAMPDGCNCGPESVSNHGTTGPQTSAPRVHRIGQRGGVVLYGHGPHRSSDPGADEANAQHCPHASADGEERARALGRAGRWEELWHLTEPFPAAPGLLQPAAPGSKAPAVWTGEPVANTPDRHVHPASRADLARLAVLAEQSGRLDRAARQAKRDAENASGDARRQAAEAAAAGTPMDAAAIARTIRERQEQAEAAQVTADGTRDAVATVREQVAAGIAERRAEWLAYLHGQAAHGLARLDLVVSELEAAVENLAEIDRVRQTVEQPSAGRLFSAGSQIAGNAVEAARQARERAAVALAGLERHAAKVSRDKSAQAA